jgi:hypothetical protein
MRSTRSWSEPSGKGVNVALALRAHNRPTVAVLPVGGPAGAHLMEMLNQTGLSYEAVPITGEVRINISLIQPDGIVTKINEQGPVLTAAEGHALLDAARTRVRAGDWLAGCGSLPGGLDDDYYAQLVETGHRADAKVVIDTSGPSLVRALAAGPDLIKPNGDELADAVGGTITTIGDVVDAAQEQRARRGKNGAGQPGSRRRPPDQRIRSNPRRGARRRRGQHRRSGRRHARRLPFRGRRHRHRTQDRPGLGSRRRPTPRHPLHHHPPFHPVTLSDSVPLNQKLTH